VPLPCVGYRRGADELMACTLGYFISAVFNAPTDYTFHGSGHNVLVAGCPVLPCGSSGPFCSSLLTVSAGSLLQKREDSVQFTVRKECCDRFTVVKNTRLLWLGP
jgi:hypothetical protein